MSPLIRLMDGDLERTRSVAVKRDHHALLYGRRPSRGLSADEDRTIGLRLRELQARGELALSRLLGVPWPAHVDTFKRQPAVPPNYEARTTRNPGACLIVRPEDPPDRVYTLMLARSSHDLVCLGWRPGSDCQQEKYWRVLQPGRPSVYAVPQSELCDPMLLSRGDAK